MFLFRNIYLFYIKVMYNNSIYNFQQMIKYQVIFKNDKSIIGTYSTRKRASNKVNKLDNEYGAYAYSVQTIEVN